MKSLNEQLILDDENQQNNNINDDHNDSKVIQERQRFSNKSSLLTILYMAIGPLSIFIQSIGDALDMLMISKRFKNEPNQHPIEILGFSGQILTITSYLGLFFGQALTSRIPTLLGSDKRDNAKKLVSDILFLCILISMIFSSLFVFFIQPMLKFLGTPNYLMNDAYKFLIPSLSTLFLTNLAIFGQNFLQSIGNSILSGLCKVFLVVLQITIFSPLFLFGFKVNTTFMKIGGIISGIVVGILMIILIYKGKFSLNPDFHSILEKFGPDLKKSLLLAAPLIFSFFIIMFPTIIILQTMTSTDPNHSKEIGGAFAVFTQIMTINNGIPGALGQSFVAAGTHAWGSKNTKRLISLFCWTILLNIFFTLLMALIVIFGKKGLSRLFLNDEIEIELSSKILPIPFYTTTIYGICIKISMLLVVVGKPLFSFIPQIIQLLVLCFGCKLIAKNVKDDVWKIMYIYNISDSIVFIIYLILLLIPIREIRKKSKDELSISEKLPSL